MKPRSYLTGVFVYALLLAIPLAYAPAMAAPVSDKAAYQAQIKKARAAKPDKSKSATATTQQLSAAVIQASGPGLLNGGFEDGTFSGWMFGDNGIPGLNPWQVCPAGSCGYFLNNQPFEGIYDALNGFDGDAGYTAYLSQDIQVPIEGASVVFYDRIQYDGLGIPSTLPRVYEVQVRDFNDIPLQVLHRQEVMLNGQPFTDLGWQRRAFNVSAYAGQTIRIYISLYVPETFTGPAQIEFDGFRLEPDTGPIAGVSGCINVDQFGLANRQVLLLQPYEQPQVTHTDFAGCYQFQNVVPGKGFDVLIRNP